MSTLSSLTGCDWRGAPVRVDIHDGRIAGVEPLIARDARSSRTILPGLHDHHVHLRAAAARSRSLDVRMCGDRDEFAALLRGAAPGRDGGVRVVGYDDTRVGVIDRAQLDAIRPEVPVRVQHRGGHLWVLNTAACDLADDAPDDGKLWDRDADIAIPSGGENIQAIARRMTSRGVTAVDDLTPTLTGSDAEALRAELAGLLRVRVFGATTHREHLDGVKVLVSDHAIPPSYDLAQTIADARPGSVALHCASIDALAVILAVTESLRPHDRIEHAFITPDGVAEALASGGILSIGAHAGFLRTHGDRLLAHGAPSDAAEYLRLRTWHSAGARLLGGTDAPFASADPWLAMQAAVDRRTISGTVIGRKEALTPEEAFTMFRSGGLDHRGARLDLTVGDPADLCVLEGTWADARDDLSGVEIVLTIQEGAITFDERPGERRSAAPECRRPLSVTSQDPDVPAGTPAASSPPLAGTDG